MGVYDLTKRILPLGLRVWLRRDLKLLRQRAGARLRGSGPLPPRDLVHLVIGVYDLDGFLESGATAARAVRDTLEEAGVGMGTLGSVLDFGCGCGRIMRHWRGLRGPALRGTDYNPALVAWCARRLPFAEFKVNPLSGPLPYADQSFDLVYAYSVFTHLSEPLQRYWVGEVRRVLKPGGLLYVTLHGAAYLETLDEGARAEFMAGRPAVVKGEQSGTNYCGVYHPESYVRGEFSRGFAVEAFRPEGARGGSRQDAYLLGKL